ncbi:MAG TPA: hypothetical protein VHS33_02240 [Sphingomicrobium sp.]|jgi:hypothetical protein|nr:hypothetical protein [Sphingomicrobium sp.]
MIFLFAFGAAVAALASAPAPASPSAGPQAIVVEGINPKRRANSYLDKVLPPIFDGQIGRFEDPLCPATIGLPDNLRDEILKRLSVVAAVARIPVEAGKCRANLLIIVVDDKKALIEGMRKKKESYLYGIGTERVNQLANSQAPVAAWQITDVIGADGMPLRTDGDGFPRLFTTVPPSRIVETTRKRITGGIVVLEQRGLVNVTTRQLADYALVRLLAPMEPKERTPPDSSILSLFNPGVRPEDAPQSLTWWDLAFLKALSDTRSDTVADVQRHEIRDRMLQEMAKVPRE